MNTEIIFQMYHTISLIVQREQRSDKTYCKYLQVLTNYHHGVIKTHVIEAISNIQ